jgi:hypothetical protein
MRIEDNSGFIPILEGYCKRGDIKPLSEFIKSKRNLMP